MRRTRAGLLGLTFLAELTACAATGDTSLKIEAFSIAPATVGDGESFDVTWKVSHPTKTGYVTESGLFVGTPADLSSASELDARRLFNLATTAGVANGVDDSSKTCTRTGTTLRCGSTEGGRDIAGVTDFTFRACSSYVLSPDDVCEMRPVSITFP